MGICFGHYTFIPSINNYEKLGNPGNLFFRYVLIIKYTYSFHSKQKKYIYYIYTYNGI